MAKDWGDRHGDTALDRLARDVARGCYGQAARLEPAGLPARRRLPARWRCSRAACLRPAAPGAKQTAETCVSKDISEPRRS